jgi:Gram-negative bacterial TonB protein C-terminal
LHFGGTIAAVNPKGILVAAIMAWSCGTSAAQSGSVAMPDSLVIARDTFWDIGPPFSYYDLIRITKTSQGLSLDQALVTPHGQGCLQPATVEERSVVLQKTMPDLLEGRNPCAIPEKDLHREIKRCKKCLVFSGVNVTMQATCSGKDRQLQMNILDRDIYDSRTPTPTNTSWSMRVLSTLNESLGPGSEAKPMFQIDAAPHHDVPNTPLVESIRDGRYDSLFGSDAHLAAIVHEAEQPPLPPPSVELETVEPATPASMDAFRYPPIAVAAHVEGEVTASFEVDADGKAQKISLEGPGLLQLSVSDAISHWKFPESAWGKAGQAAVRFHLNCAAITN